MQFPREEKAYLTVKIMSEFSGGGGANLLFWPISSQNCMKMNKTGTRSKGNVYVWFFCDNRNMMADKLFKFDATGLA